MTGTLGLFSLVDLFQLLSSATRTGRLAIEHPTAYARVYFDRGHVVHAEFGDLEGSDAIFALFDDERGGFEFTIGLPAPRRTIEMSTENLVLEAIRRLDEARRDSVVDSVPRTAIPLFSDKDATKLTLTPNELEILQRIDGRRNVTQLAEDAGADPEQVMAVVGRLVKVGMLRLRTNAPRTARLVTRLSTERLARGAVGIDIGILTNWHRTLGYRPERVACKTEDGRVLAFPVQPIEGAGPYLHVTREIVFQSGLGADQTLLVKPLAEDRA